MDRDKKWKDPLDFLVGELMLNVRFTQSNFGTVGTAYCEGRIVAEAEGPDTQEVVEMLAIMCQRYRDVPRGCLWLPKFCSGKLQSAFEPRPKIEEVKKHCLGDFSEEEANDPAIDRAWEKVAKEWEKEEAEAENE